MNWFGRLKQGLTKTRESTIGRIAAIVTGRGKLDEETLSEIEECLLLSDIGVEIAENLIAGLSNKAREERRNDVDFVMDYLGTEIAKIARGEEAEIAISQKPWIILVVGVNGVGKTTTIGKMAHHFAAQGKKVLLAAGDTFRAAAGEQLELWAERAKVGIIRHQDGSDPASVAYDAAAAARARGVDILLIDTAGRLHTKSNLMEELKKIDRVLKKFDPAYPHETLLVIDATTGQNALTQARVFNEMVGCTGVVVTKLDGTAKGGMILALRKELRLPVRMIGVGEGIDDLRPFDAAEFSRALFDWSPAKEKVS